MNTQDLDEFANVLIKHVRDNAIKNCDNILEDNSTDVGKRWNEALTGDPKILVKTLIADVVDESIATLLYSIDQGLLKMSFETSTKNQINLSSDGMGELCGWYMGSGGWRARFSRERFEDDFKDL
jgi:hypothetical protein